MNFGDEEIWDEFRWEEFMRRQEKKLDKYLELFYRYSGDPEQERKLAEVMGLADLLNFERGSGEGEAGASSTEVEEDLEGESWKRIAGYKEYDDQRAALERLPAYRLAYDFAAKVSSIVESLSSQSKEDSTVVEFLSQALLAPAKVAAGYAMGIELDVLGGNIASCKRALAASNEAIESLLQLRTRGIVPEDLHIRLVKGAVEARNAIAARVVDLREQFRSGLP